VPGAGSEIGMRFPFASLLAKRDHNKQQEKERERFVPCILGTDQTSNKNSSSTSVIMSHRSNSNRGATASAEARLQDISATLRRERDDAYRQAALATERFTAIQEEEVALIKTVSDMQAKLATLQQQAGGAVQAEIETAKGQVQTLNQQVRMSECVSVALHSSSAMPFQRSHTNLYSRCSLLFSCAG